MNKQLTDVACVVQRITEKAIAVADGSTEDVTDDRTGDRVEREAWFWLPKSVIEVEPPEYDVGDAVTVTLPERIAIEKGLL